MDNSTVAQVGKVGYTPEESVLVDQDSPMRCQHSHNRQCNYKKIEGQNYCSYHIALYNPNFRKQQRLKKYRLTQMYMRVEEFVTNPELKNLSEEIAILNNTLEVVTSQCHTPFDVIINAARVESLVEKIAKVTQANQRIMMMAGKALDEVSLSFLVDTFTNALIDEALPEETLKRIAQKVSEGLQKAKALSVENSMKEK